jgi:hypothetical protein
LIETARSAINQRFFADVDLIVLPTLVEPSPRSSSAPRRRAQAVSPASTFFAK